MFDNMTQREKYMAFAVAAMLPIVLLFFGVTSISKNLKKKETTLTQLKKQKEALKIQQLQGELALVRYQKYLQTSLPSDTQNSVTQYKLWLQELGSELGYIVEVKNRNSPLPLIGDNRQIIGSVYRFEISRCECTLKQLTDLIYRINQAKMLHRISHLTITARTEGKGTNLTPNGILGVKMTVRAVCLNEAAQQRQFENELVEEMPRSLDEYHRLITRRDMFGLPNTAPELSGKSSYEFNVGSNVYIDVDGYDEDEGQELKLEFSKPVVADLANSDDSFDPASVIFEDGTVELGRAPVGVYTFSITATDNGWGEKQAEKRYRVEVVPVASAPAATARLESRDTKISAKLLLDGQPLIVLDIRPIGEKPELGVGDVFELDKKTWKITDIGEDSVTIQVEGNSMTYSIGAFLSDPNETIAVKDDADSETQE